MRGAPRRSASRWAGTGQGARQATLRMKGLVRARDARAAGELFERWRAGEEGAREELGEFKPSLATYNMYLISQRVGRRSSARELLELVAEMPEHGVRPGLKSFEICVRQARSAGEVRDVLGAAEAAGLAPEVETFCGAAETAMRLDESGGLALELLGRARAALAAETQPSNVPKGIKAFSRARVKVMLGCLTPSGDVDRAVQLLEEMEADRQQVPLEALGDLVAQGLARARSDVVLRALRALETMRRGEGLMAERREGATGQRGGRGRGQGAPAPDEGTLTSCLALAARHADVELGEAAWGLLAAALGEGRAPSAPAYQAYVNLFGAAGDLPRAFGALAGMEVALEGAGGEGARGALPPLRGFDAVLAAAMQPPAERLRSASWHDAVAERLQAGLAALQARKAAGERVPRLAPALLVAASSKAGHLEKAFEVFEAADSLGVRPDAALFNALMGGCIDNGRSDTVPALLEEMASFGLAPDAETRALQVQNALLERSAEGAAAHLRDLREAGGRAPDGVLEACARAVCRFDHLEPRAGPPPAGPAQGAESAGEPTGFSREGIRLLRREIEAANFSPERLRRLNQRTTKMWEVFAEGEDHFRHPSAARF